CIFYLSNAAGRRFDFGCHWLKTEYRNYFSFILGAALGMDNTVVNLDRTNSRFPLRRTLDLLQASPVHRSVPGACALQPKVIAALERKLTGCSGGDEFGPPST